MKHYITLAAASLVFIASVLLMFFNLNIFMMVPALVSFQIADNAYESIKTSDR